MNKFKFVVFSCIIFVICQGVSSYLTRRPQNTTVYAGQSAKFSCTSDDPLPINWFFDDTGKVCVNGQITEKYRGHFSVEVSQDGAYVLSIWNTTSANSGKYTCVDKTEFQGADKDSAWLVVEEAVLPVTVAASEATMTPVDKATSSSIKILVPVLICSGILFIIGVVFGVWFRRKSVRRRRLSKNDRPLLNHSTNSHQPSPCQDGDARVEVSSQHLVCKSTDEAFRKEEWMSSHDAARSDHQETISNQPIKQIAVEFPCPGSRVSGKCDPMNRSWFCDKCQRLLLYGFNGFFYCSCGQAKCSTFAFKCTDTKHGEDFETFPGDSLEGLLKDFKPRLNILLLGETGVGKSTFVNAFANCFKFKAIGDAKRGGPEFPIPAYFTTMDNNYKQVEICTDEEKYKNKRYHLGQLDTQIPSLYEFPLNGMTVNLIDTPGIGDPRGVDADAVHLHKIIEHLSNFDEVHGICIFLKPANNEFNIMFKFCVTKLLEQLPADAFENIVICFTNSKGTFFKPGNTIGIQTLLEEKNADMKLSQDNIFCVDNEAVRYLAAVYTDKNCMDWNETSFENSWTQSVTEYNRMIDYILKLKPCRYKIKTILKMTT